MKCRERKKRICEWAHLFGPSKPMQKSIQSQKGKGRLGVGWSPEAESHRGLTGAMPSLESGTEPWALEGRFTCVNAGHAAKHPSVWGGEALP